VSALARSLVAVAWLLAALAARAGEAPPAALLVRNARLLDMTGAPPREGVSVLVRDGRIAAIGAEIAAPPDAATLDAAGATLLPGLVDSHVHMSAAPGGYARGDSPETLRALNRHHLRAYLACGVTTVLDPGVFARVMREVREDLASGQPGPRYLATGPVLRMPDGYGHPDFGSVATAADVEAKLDEIAALGGVGVKLAIEKGASLTSAEPYSPEVAAAIADGAHRRGLPLYVHAMTEAAQSEALDLGAHAIVHANMGIPLVGSFGAPPDLSDAFVARLRASGAYQLSTLSVFDTFPGAYDVARLDDPRVALVVPAVEFATARASDAEDRFAIGALGWAVPWTFERTRPWLYRMLVTPEHLRAAIRQGQRNLLRLHRAGVPIVAATDAPSPWPNAIYHFHGPQLAREIELLVEAGFTPEEALVAATRTPARMLGLDAEIGTVEVGKRADLVVVRGDPLADPRALRDVMWTVRDGVARTSEGWMAAAE